MYEGEAIVSFSVNTKALVGAAIALERRGRELTVADRYVAAETHLATFSLANVHGTHQHVVTALMAYLSGLTETFADQDAIRIRAAIQAYDETDARAAGRTDATMPGLLSGLPQTPPLTAAENAYGPAIFGDRRDPSAALIPPASHETDIPYQPSWSDLLSPTSLARDAIWKVSGLLTDLGLLERPVDPLDVLLRPFVGDWAGLLRCAEVFTHVGDMLPQTADCVDDIHDLVPTVWTGNVAEMCGVNLGGFATAVRGGITPLQRLASTYEQVARGVAANEKVMATIITSLSDLAIDVALTEAGAVILAAASAGSQVRTFLRLLRLALTIANDVQDAISAWRSGAVSVANGLGLLTVVGPVFTVDAAIPVIPVPPATPRRPRERLIVR